MRYYVGWDVGAWHCDKGKSRDALCCLSSNSKKGPLEWLPNPFRGNLREVLITEHKRHVDMVEAVLQRVGIKTCSHDSVTIAIDTPLAWPTAFLALAKNQGARNPGVPAKKTDNPLLLRDVERKLAQHGRTPLSPVQDMIGSQSTKGLYFLRRGGLRTTRTGVWETKLKSGAGVTAIETYPAPCKGVDTAEEHLKRFRGELQGDRLDALYCAAVAYLFSTQRGKLKGPSKMVPEDEGWIWLPKKCWE